MEPILVMICGTLKSYSNMFFIDDMMVTAALIPQSKGSFKLRRALAVQKLGASSLAACAMPSTYINVEL